MEMIFSATKQTNFISPTQQQPFFLTQNYEPPPSNNDYSTGFDLNSKVSPSLLLIIVILAIIFFVSGLLHLLVRFMLRPPNRNPEDLDSVSALQGQLQQLFHLHDAGVDQSFIDQLPVFHYKAIIGLKDPFDCAVCLCEYEFEDKLRLLPKCSHAFHMECIDTWLLSHSTCPLCRASLLLEFSPNNSCSPLVYVLESGSESSIDILPGRDSTHSILRTSSQLGVCRNDEIGSARVDISRKSCESNVGVDSNDVGTVSLGEKVVAVKLGKFKNVDGNSTISSDSGGGGGEGSSDNNADARRCFSMGSFEYVMDDKSSLHVPIISIPAKKQPSKKPQLPLTPGHRLARSECDFESRRELNAFDAYKCIDHVHETSTNNTSKITSNDRGNSMVKSKRESFSVSKIWMRGKKELKENQSEDAGSRRAFSFRVPHNKNAGDYQGNDDLKSKKSVTYNDRRSNSEIVLGSELGYDEENQINCNNIILDSQAKTPSLARRTLLWWLVGKQNKVNHSSSGPAV